MFSWTGSLIVVVFFTAYGFVFAEEKLRLRKSKPVMLAAGVIWILVAIAFQQEGRGAEVAEKLRRVVLEYAELLLFLLTAMTFVNVLIERHVFESLRARLTSAGLSTRGIFWMTGFCAFFLSPIADNMTTALVMGTVVFSVLGHDKKAVSAGLVNVVVAANAGGAFSPFGDITTLMIWQKGVVEFGLFFALFVPALVNWLVPAVIISSMLHNKQPETKRETVKVRKGGYVIIALFLATIGTTVFLDHALHLPPFFGMMLGLGVLNVYSYFINGAEVRASLTKEKKGSRKLFDIFGVIEKVEWDTLLFFYGVMLCVGGIGAVGYLESVSKLLYSGLGNTTANIAIGLLSAIVDNIPLTYAVLTMEPKMDVGQWLLVTLTAGVGGSLLSIGSAAGVALMGIGRGSYTFISHFKWIWAIMLGFAASVIAHIVLNQSLFVS